MILDSLLVLAEDVTTTTSVASTSTVNTVAAGDSYAGAWFYVQVSTAFTAALGAPTTSFLLETSSVEAFTSDCITLITTAALVVADLPAGKQLKVRIPPGAKKYIRGYKSVTNYAAASIALATCGYTMMIVKDVEIPVQNPDVLA